MLIERVTLKNFRCHGDKTIEFSRGINLILGENGAGKSSILEAVGLALIGENNSRNNKDQIKIGEKKALIEVEFIGSDENKYRVEKTFSQTGASTTKLFMAASDFPISSKAEEVQLLCAGLMGLKTNHEILYRNVITAYQNKFVSMFAAGKENETTINSIFNTEVYRNISDEIGKIIKNNYETPIKYKADELSRKKESLINSDELQEEISKLEEGISALNLNIEKGEINKKELEKQIEQLKNIKVKIEKLQLTYKEKTNFQSSKQSSLEKTNLNINSSEAAKKILEDNQKDYEAYSEKQGENSKLEKTISDLEKKDKTKQKLEKELSSAKQELVKLEADTENIKQKLEKSIEILAEEEAKISGFNTEKGSYNSSLEQTENIFTKQQSTASELKNKIKEIEKIEKDIDTNNKILEEKKVSTDLDEIANKIIELESSLEKLSQSKAEKDKLLVEINSLKSRLSDNADAEKQLKSGCCPILKEECKNVSGGSASEYFINKADEISRKIEEIKVKIEKDFAKVEEQIKAKNKEISELNAEKNNTISILKEREKLQAKLNKLFQDKESKKSLLTKVLFANGIQSNPDDYESILKILSDEEQKIKIEINTFSVKIEEINKLLLQSSQVSEKQKKEIDKLKKDISKTDKASGETKNSIENTEAEIKNLIQALLDFESIKQKKSIINSELEILKPAYEAYTANKKTAESLTKLLKEKEDISFEIIKLGKELESIHSEINSLKDSYSETQLNELMLQKQIIESKLKELHKELIESSTQKAEKQSKLEQNIKLLDEILKMEAEISLLTRKKEIGDKYRANLKEMGRMAAVRMIRRIEIAATENYKMLSGKPETIIWEAGERSYSLKLKAGENNIRSFEMLSGGEQVTIALAMRAALASNLTEANFAIFDEPTINLDNARKTALSESLQKMLASVKQSIIVTHDKIFEEFAEKVHYIV